MSIILKGIDIPEKENRMYMMELYADGHCSVAKIEDGECYELTIPSETEAIQIPKGHGRLIDADKVDYDEFWHREGHGFTMRVCHKAQKIIEEQPTILDKEGK
jgi:hypothetical protein